MHINFYTLVSSSSFSLTVKVIVAFGLRVWSLGRTDQLMLYSHQVKTSD